jgi:hypothetical protein
MGAPPGPPRQHDEKLAAHQALAARLNGKLLCPDLIISTGGARQTHEGRALTKGITLILLLGRADGAHEKETAAGPINEAAAAAPARSSASQSSPRLLPRRRVL